MNDPTHQTNRTTEPTVDELLIHPKGTTAAADHVEQRSVLTQFYMINESSKKNLLKQNNINIANTETAVCSRFTFQKSL